MRGGGGGGRKSEIDDFFKFIYLKKKINCLIN